MANMQLSTNYEPFPDPFQDVASQRMPNTISDVLRFCDALWSQNGTYRMAMERVVSYFLTDVELTDIDDDEKHRYSDFLNDTLDIKSNLRLLGMDFMFYGNSFSSLYIPFRRHLQCPDCGFEQPIDEIDYKFRNFEFLATCRNPKCGFHGSFRRNDRRTYEEDLVRVVRWSPHQIKILFHPVSHRAIYIWKIPESFSEEIRKGTPFYIEDTPWEIIQAVQNKQDFQFHPHVIYHMKEATLAGIENRGWGVPRALSNFRQAWYLQVLKRYNEAIGLDYIVPFRVITPSSRGRGELDPMLNQNLSGFKRNVMSMLNRHRRDPANWNVLPFAVEYQALSGEGTELAPYEMMTQATDELLNAVGVPAELYRGSVEMQVMPSALRLFEATWPHLVSGYNGWLSWLFDQMASEFNWERPRGKLQRVTLADDMEAKHIRLMLAQGNQISMQSAFSPLGINVHDEIDRKIEEEKYLAKRQQELQEELERTQAARQSLLGQPPTMQQGAEAGMAPGGGGMPPMGGPPAMGGGAGATPGDMVAQAEQMAQQLIGAPQSVVRQQLSALKQSDQTLYALVKSKMEQLRQDAASAGRMQLNQMAASGQV